MKYVVIQGDGMSDYPVESLGGKTPLQAARTENMDALAARGRLGTVQTIPEGMPSGTDVGTMTILGYDPKRYHTGRSPIEAASMGVDLGETGIAYRCNLVTIDRSGSEPVMRDFTAGHIGNDEAAELIAALQERLGSDVLRFHPGVSYRHIMVWENGPDSALTTPPHDIADQPVAEFLPAGEGEDELARISREARAILAEHPVNVTRRARGESEATDVWLWGQGGKPSVPTLEEQFGVRGALITAVDVVGGLGFLAGMDRIDVPGITGFIDTNYVGKGEYALAALKDHDLIFVHVESTDETGHMGDADLKVKAIEDLDEKVIGTILRGLDEFGDWRILVLPDHATPVSTRTHADDPVPFILADSRSGAADRDRPYSEESAAATGDHIHAGHELISELVSAT